MSLFMDNFPTSACSSLSYLYSITIENCFCKTLFQVGMDLKKLSTENYPTSARKTSAKKHSNCRVDVLSSLPCFCNFFRSIPTWNTVLQKRFPYSFCSFGGFLNQPPNRRQKRVYCAGNKRASSWRWTRWKQGMRGSLLPVMHAFSNLGVAWLYMPCPHEPQNIWNDLE